MSTSRQQKQCDRSLLGLVPSAVLQLAPGEAVGRPRPIQYGALNNFRRCPLLEQLASCGCNQLGEISVALGIHEDIRGYNGLHVLLLRTQLQRTQDDQ